ncbi:unnamed protein product [Phaedon cochleariae]|uniref:Uncharacterized protein n=1 Tax=Phaedon cochleariae TaxID=80249 RepID=A0A9N9SFP0_PHACE|nr:unnamed protein product [Phaedon cochleariae]
MCITVERNDKFTCGFGASEEAVSVLTVDSSFGNPSTHDDLEQIPENDGTNGTSTTRCNFTDLHPPTSTSRMVINLRAAASHADQSVTHFSSRDPTTTIRSTVPIRQRQSAAFSWSEASVQCAYSDVNTGGDMQVNVTADAPATAPLVQVPDIGTTGDHGLRNRTSFFQDASLSSANVVGLPCHNRYASVPVTCGPSRPTTTHGLLPIHSRNISEPFNHSRSSSVPKCMPAVARQESGTTTTTTTVPSSSRFAQQVNNANVSNVNVNFYRAVPVNVVSSVPTIRCLNSSNNGQGNEVSNVQVLPLGSGYESHVSASSAGVTSCSVPSSSGGTVQVVTGCVPTIQIKGGEARTFTSTEAQTDEISVLPSSGEEDRERRRRERRDRRQQRRSAPVTPRAPEGDNFVGVGNPRLPDLLNSHQPPPYTTLGSGVLPPQAPLGVPPHQLAVLQTVVPNNVVPHSGFVFPGAPTGVVPGHHQVPMVQGVAPVAVPHADVGGFRFPFPVAGFSR